MNLKIKLYLSYFIFIMVDALLLAAIFFWIIPGTEKLFKIQSDVALLQQESSQFGSIKDSYSRLKPDINKADNMLIDGDAPFVFLSFLENTAKKDDLKIDILPASNLEKYADDNWNYIGLQINLIGESAKIWKFIEELENGPYITTIQDINVLRFFDDELKLSSAKANISLKAYTKAQDENKK